MAASVRTRTVAVGHDLHAEGRARDGGHVDLRVRVHVHLVQCLAVGVALAVALDAPELLGKRMDRKVRAVGALNGAVVWGARTPAHYL